MSIFGWDFGVGEFILGVAVGLILGWLFRRLGLGPGRLGGWLQAHAERLGESLASGTTDRHREDLALRAQLRHMVRALFTLDDIVVAPRVLAPPPPADPQRSEPLPEHALAVLPNLPDWDTLSGVYCAPALSLAEALAGGANLLLTGWPGSGKSTALAYLALRVAARHPDAGALASSVPVLIHACDLRLETRSAGDPLAALVGAAQHAAGPGIASRLPGYLRLHFRQGRGLLLLDGLDLLTPEEIAPVAEWLQALSAAFPGTRVVAAGSFHGSGSLVRAGLTPVPLAPWGEHERRQFLSRWGEGWQKSVLPTLPKGRVAEPDPVLIYGWLLGPTCGETPLGLTLRAWAAYAGDVRGPQGADGMEAYLARFLSPEERLAAEGAAAAWIAGRKGAVAERDLPRGTPVGDLVEAGVMVRHPGGRVSFAQPSVGAYLAAHAWANSEPPQAEAGGWAPAEEAMRWHAALGDASAQAASCLQAAADPLSARLLGCARWLAEAPAKAPWRPLILRALASMVQDPDRPYGLRLRAVHALASAHEPSVALFFRHLLSAEAASSRILAALGSGGVRDEEAVAALRQEVESDDDLLARQAACLALAAIGNQPALEALGQALLTGKEGVRLAAGEALAIHPDEGYEMLREALEVENLMTRRAAVFGLGRVPEAWALEALDKVLAQDKQWVVRGAAAEAADRRRNPPWKVVPPAREPSELPWLIAYAAREGLGVAPGRPALEAVRRALGSGSLEEKIAALEALAWIGSEDFQIELSGALRSGEPHVRDAAYEALWRLAAAGASAPSPVPAPAP